VIETKNLANGTVLLQETVESTDTVSIGFWFTHGSRDEREGEHGFSHFLEHMLFKGTRKRTAYQIASDIDRVGGLLNAFTEKETTCFYSIVPKEAIELSIDILTDMLSNSIISDTDVAREKLVVENEIRAVEDSPEEIAHELYLKELWNNHPLVRKITGNMEDVKKFEREKLLKFYHENYRLENAIISVAGNFNGEQVTGILHERIKKRTKGRKDYSRKPPQSNTFNHYISSNFNQVQIYAGLPFIPRNRLEDYYDMVVLSTIFGESISSRLFQELRENKGLCYTVYSYRTYFSDIALWTVYASTGPSQTEELISALKRETEKLKNNPPSKEEIENAKSHLRGSIVLAKEDMETRMKRMVRQYILRGDVFPFEKSLEYIEEVNRTRIAERIEKLFKEKDFSYLVYGNRER